MRWTYPVFKRAAAAEESSEKSAVGQYALPIERAYAELAGEDKRPLLILRECLTCNGTDDALLQAQADNERTLLMTRWFHCVKLPVDVMTKEDHPFHALFAGESPPHLLVCDFDGSNMRPLESERSRTELWDVLSQSVERNYELDLRKPLKGLQKTLDELDVIDTRVLQLQDDLDSSVEKKGPANAKTKKIAKKLEGAKEQLAEIQTQIDELSNLKLIERKKAAASAEAGR